MARRLTKAERAFELERAKKLKEFRAGYNALLDQQDQLAELGVTLSRISIDEYVNFRIEEWESNYYVEPVGRFEDPNLTRIEFQGQFIEYVLEEFPEAFEELIRLSNGYNAVFGNGHTSYEPLFHYETLEAIENWSFSVKTWLSNPFPGVGVHISIPEMDYTQFRYDFRLRSSLSCFLVAKAIFDTANPDHVRRGKEVLKDGLEFAGPETPDTNYLRENRDQLVDLLIKKYQQRDESWNHLRNGWDGLDRICKLLNPDIPSTTSQLTTFLIDLIDWAERFNLGKTWIVRYGLYYLGSHVAGMINSDEKPEIPRLRSTVPVGLPVNFEFRGWNTYDEKKQDYEKLIRREFDKHLKSYFKQTYIALDLGTRKRRTKPIDFSRVRWVVQANIAGLSLDEIHSTIIGNDDNAPGKFLNDESIEQAISDMCRFYDLPKKRSSDLSF